MNLSLNNPIPEVIKDPIELGEFFDKYSIIPYYGNTEGSSHSMLNLLSDLSVLSASHRACKQDIKTYAFSNKVDLIKSPIPGLILDTDYTISNAEKINFNANFLERYGINLNNIVNINRDSYESLADSGNGYIRVRIVNIGGTVKVYFKVLHYKHCAYLRTKNTEDRILIYTKKWGDEVYWLNNPPEIYKVSYLGNTFNWGIKKNGTIKETVLHIRNQIDESDYYGRPNILSVLYWMYVEFSQSDLAVKTSSTEFVSKMLLAFEETDPTRLKKGSEEESRQSTFRKRMAVLRSLTSNEGAIDEAKTLAGIEYPFGGKPPVAIPLNINRDVKYNEFNIDKSSSYIYSIHGWDKQLTGFEPARSNIGGNIIIDLFTVKNTGTIKPLQEYWTDVWANIFKEIGIQVNYTGEIYTIKYKNLIKDLVDELIASKAGKTEELLKADEIQAIEDVGQNIDEINAIGLN